MELLVLSPSALCGFNTPVGGNTVQLQLGAFSLPFCSQSYPHPALNIQKVSRAVCQQARRQKFSRSYEVALEMQLTDASPPPSHQMSARVAGFWADFRGLSMYTCSVSTSGVLS